MLAAVAATLLVSGCQDKKKQARHDAMVELMHGNTPDADMAAAMEKAKSTLPEFLATMQHPGAGQSKFLVRAVFPAEGGKQQILWINQLTYDGTLLHGVADDNTSKKGSGIPKDGKVAVELSKVADWMYEDNGKAAGGWTLRVLRKKYPAECEELPSLRDMQFKE